MIIRRPRTLHDDRREMMSRPSRVGNYSRRPMRKDACIERKPRPVIKDDEVTDLVSILKNEGVEVKDLIACVKAYLESVKKEEVEEEETPDEIQETDEPVEETDEPVDEVVVSFDSKKAVGSLLKTNDSKVSNNNNDIANAWLKRYKK